MGIFLHNDGDKTFSTQKPKLPDLVRQTLRTKHYHKIKTVRIVAKNELWDFNKNHILANKLILKEVPCQTLINSILHNCSVPQNLFLHHRHPFPLKK